MSESCQVDLEIGALIAEALDMIYMSVGCKKETTSGLLRDICTSCSLFLRSMGIGNGGWQALTNGSCH